MAADEKTLTNDQVVVQNSTKKIYGDAVEKAKMLLQKASTERAEQTRVFSEGVEKIAHALLALRKVVEESQRRGGCSAKIPGSDHAV